MKNLQDWVQQCRQWLPNLTGLQQWHQVILQH